MGRRTARTPGLWPLLLATATALAGCGYDSGSVTVLPSSPASERARLLATCPAEVRPWYEGLPPVEGDPEQIRREAIVQRAADVAEAYLDRLPADQVGVLRTEPHRTAVVVQVTRDVDADRVRRELQRRIGDGVRAEVETVRWSHAELLRAEDAIRDLEGLEWNGLGTGADGHVEVSVPGDPAAAEALIAKELDRCTFRVTQGTMTLDG